METQATRAGMGTGTASEDAEAQFSKRAEEIKEWLTLNMISPEDARAEMTRARATRDAAIKDATAPAAPEHQQPWHAEFLARSVGKELKAAPAKPGSY